MPRTYNELNELLRKANKENAVQKAQIKLLESEVDYLEQSKVSVYDVDNIQNIDPQILDVLHSGDVIRKSTGNQKHSYVVSYKENGVGICLTYTDASIVETVSYDKSGDNWLYNSTDLTHLPTDAKQQSWDDKSVVVANPTLAGTEPSLEGLEVNGVKYKAGGGEEIHLYSHQLKVFAGALSNNFYVTGLSTKATLTDNEKIEMFLQYNQIRGTVQYVSNQAVIVTGVEMSTVSSITLYMKKVSDGTSVTAQAFNLSTFADTVTQIF